MLNMRLCAEDIGFGELGLQFVDPGQWGVSVSEWERFALVDGRVEQRVAVAAAFQLVLEGLVVAKDLGQGGGTS